MQPVPNANANANASARMNRLIEEINNANKALHFSQDARLMNRANRWLIEFRVTCYRSNSVCLCV